MTGRACPLVHQRAARQRGVALLVVLLLLASIAVVALTTTQLMARAAARTAAAQARDGAVWALMGAEAAATAVLEANAAEADKLTDRWLAAPVTLPIAGARVTGGFTDRPCLNVNAFVVRNEDAYETPQELTPGMVMFGTLIEALGGNQVAGLALAGAAADFIDTDDRPGPAGGEDFGYAREAVPRLTAGGLLADASELRAVIGWDADTYAALKPYLCALPTAEPAQLNVNTLTPADAPLLRAALGPATSTSEAERLIAQRPQEGYDSLDAFLSRLREPPQGAPLSVQSTLVTFRATVQDARQELSLTTTFSKTGGEWTPIARVFGAPEARR